MKGNRLKVEIALLIPSDLISGEGGASSHGETLSSYDSSAIYLTEMRNRAISRIMSSMPYNAA